jgi:predicted TIM-barrel fold metal-dependent hydrolase
LLDDFDRFAASVHESITFEPGVAGRKPAEFDELCCTYAEDVGVNDPYQRLQNMDADGIAAEVIFHNTGEYSRQTGAIPFVSPAASKMGPWGAEHQAAGRRMYNRWLADFCSVDPDRLLGVVELPYWDIDASVAEIEWAAGAGFRCVNFAASRVATPTAGLPTIDGPAVNMPTYDDPVWEPFWNVVEATGMSLNCHSGAPLHAFPNGGLASRALFWSETPYMGRLALPMMCFGGVFKRHPTLRVIFNEQRGYWVWQTLRDLDAVFANPWNRLLRQEIGQSPSEYWRQNCFLGGSFLARFELEHMEEIGVETITWGRDYPHVEGTWPFTLESLRTAFAGVPSGQVRQILGDNGIRCYGLDPARTADIAATVGPTPEAVDEALSATPEGAWGWAFRDREDAKGGARFGAY